jgi:peptidoglycan/xylan/chitin deacetylase (PgdA/CDA1 family)/acyl-CoA synthetase (AMP-forming)/AMP-acid ligase II
MPALISHRTPRAMMAWSNGRAITALDYLAAVRHMASRLPQNAAVLNLCSRRHHFAVVLGAALLRGVPLLLPSTRTAEMLQRLGRNYPGLHAVVDAPGDSGGLPQIVYERGPIPAADQPFEVPDIDGEQIAAYVFTSGSTGEPVPHAKHWGPLVQNAQGAGRRVREWLGTDQPFTVTGTVPPQHMYGFESTVLLPLLNEGVIDASHPFYPADIAAALQSTPEPRVLVSTPFHLRTLIEAQLTVPPLSLLLCATAPLAPQLARQAEEALGAPLLEIYGSTETGQIATRRCAAGDLWQTFDGVEVLAEPVGEGEPRFTARGGHVEGVVPLGDVLELQSPTRFALLGRHADMVNIAGKRTSLAYLNHQLGSIPGVVDAALYWPQDPTLDAQGRIQRPIAFVVAPTLSEAELQHAMRERIDPAFLPRPIHFLPALPRNATGKLPQQALAQLALQFAQERGPTRANPALAGPDPAARWKPSPFVQVSLGVHTVAAAGLLTPAWPLSLGALAVNHALIAASGLWPRSTWLGANLTHLSRQRPEVAITIDDGPDPEVTPAVLDLLDELQAQATFFCIGAHAQRHPALAREIVRRGHALGNHSQHHRHHFSVMGPGQLRREISAAQAALEDITGQSPRFFRAPAGLRNIFLDPVLHSLGLQLASWTRRGFDTRTGKADLVLRRLTRDLGPGDILLLHDHHAALTPAGRPVLLDVLPPLLTALRAKGLQAVRLDSHLRAP